MFRERILDPNDPSLHTEDEKEEAETSYLNALMTEAWIDHVNSLNGYEPVPFDDFDPLSPLSESIYDE